MSVPNTPRRKSKRGQPIAIAPAAFSGSSCPDRLPPTPLYTRPSREDDFLDEEISDLESYKTHFYPSFTRAAAPTQTRRAPTRTYGKKTRPRTSDSNSTTIFSVGDTVLVKTLVLTPTVQIPDVGVIVAIWQVEGEEIPEDSYVRVQVHWFTRPRQLATFRAKRDFCENEILYLLDTSTTVPSSAILSACTISSSSSAVIRDPNDDAVHDHLFCRYAINKLRGLYYDLHWDSFHTAALANAQTAANAGDGAWPCTGAWNVELPPEPAQRSKDEDPRGEREGPRKRRRIAKDEDVEESEANDSADEFRASGGEEDDDNDEKIDELAGDDEDDDPSQLMEPHTPSRRKRAPARPRTPKTPRTPRRPHADKASQAQPTPHSKAALRRRKKTALAVRPPPAAEGTLERALAEGLEGNAWERAMHVLHVAARPGALPCREMEYGRVLRAVEELLEEGSGGCIYISGVPGTGKTATVHAVVRELKRMAEHNEANPFAYVEINGLKIPEPAASYGLLWEAVCGHDAAKDGHMNVSSKEALRNLSKHFSGAHRVGPSGGHACVVLMDELDQLMTTKQDVVYNFFNWPTLAGSKLVVLAVANTMDLPERVMTGRVRSRLGMVRINFQPYTTPQLEQIVKARLAAARVGLPADTPDVLAPDAVKFAAMKVSSISGDARRVLDICRRATELVAPVRKTARMGDVTAVIKEMQNSPTAAYLRELAFHERIMLASVVKCVRKTGVEEIKWGDVQHQHLILLNLLASDTYDDCSRRPSMDELVLVRDGLLAAHAMICEDGAAVGRRPEGERRVALNLEYGEVERVLGEVGGPKWRNALNV